MITNTQRRQDIVGTGGAGPFSYQFMILNDTDLAVYVDGNLKTLTTHYTVSGVGNESGGTITFTTGNYPALSADIILLGAEAETQTHDFQVAAVLPAASLEESVDKLTRLVQQLTERVNRSPVLPVGDSGGFSALALPAPGDGQYLRWSGNQLALGTPTLVPDDVPAGGGNYDHLIVNGSGAVAWGQALYHYAANFKNIALYGNSLSNAVSSIGGSTKVCLLISEPISVTGNITVTPNITLQFVGAGALNVASGMTVAFDSPLQIVAPGAQIFSGSGSVTFSTVRTVYVQWWGNTSLALQAALNTGSNVCILPGTISLTTGVVMNHDNQALYGLGKSSILSNASATGLFCAIGIVANTVGVTVRDFTLLGNASSEPAGPSPVRGIVLGTNSDGTAHSATSWDANALIENVWISGVTPGTTGFNVCMQLNKGNKSLVKDCVLESMYGTNGNFGYGIVCHGEDIDIVHVRALATISGQGRHAFYLTSTPMRVRVIDCVADGFQGEPFTSNISSGGVGMEFINCISVNCAQATVGSHDACFAFHGGSKGRISGCRAYGSTRSSNNFGVTVKDHDHAEVTDIYMENVDRHGVYIENADYCRVKNVAMNLVGIEDVSLYGGLTIIQSNYVDVDGLMVVGPGRFVARLDSSSPQPTYCRIRNLLYSGSFTYMIENYDIGPDTNHVSEFTIPIIPRASLPAAAAGMNGRVVIDDNGTGDRNLVVYAGGQRFRIDGGANV